MSELEIIKNDEERIYANLEPYLDEDFIDLINSNSERVYLVFSDDIYSFCMKCFLSPKDLFYNENISNEALNKLKDVHFNMLSKYCDILSYKLYEVFNACKNAKIYVMDFLDIYKEDHEIISKIDLNDKKQVECLDLYLKIKRIAKWYEPGLIKNRTVDDILKIKSKTIKYLKKIVNMQNPRTMFKVQENITDILFDLEYSVFLTAFENITEIDKKKPLPKGVMEKINKIIKLDKIENDKKSYLKYLSSISGYYNIFEETYNIIKDICKNEIVKTIHPIIKDNSQYNLNGEDFTFLIHAFSSLNRQDEDICFSKNEIIENPRLWTSNENIGSIISTSLINQYSLCNASNGKLFFGFNQIYSTDILDMGATDILSNKNMYMDHVGNSYSQFLLPNEIITQTLVYNEIVLKRYRDRKPLLPNYILTLDESFEDSKTLSNYFNVPIYNINTEKYLIIMLEHLNYLFNHNLDDYLSYSIIMIESFKFEGSKEIINKYFSGDFIKKTITLLLNKIDEVQDKKIKNDLIYHASLLISKYNEMFIKCIDDSNFNYYYSMRELEKIKKKTQKKS